MIPQKLQQTPFFCAGAEKGKALECNTAGYKYGLGHPNPHEAILKRYHDLGGELLTIGSDAHRPEEVGKEFREYLKILSAGL